MSIRRALAHTQSVLLEGNLALNARDRIDPAWIEQALQGCEGIGVRRRKMPAEVVVWLVVGACLFADMSFVDVMRHLGLTAPTRRGSRQAQPSAGSIAEARRRVPSEGMARILRICAAKWLEETDHSRFHGLRILAADGLTLRLQDTPSNEDHFGRPPSGQGVAAAWPQARVVCLVDVVTHLVVDVAVGPYRRVEVPLFEELVPRVPDRTITILDRGFRSFATLYSLQSAGTDRHWAVRTWKGLKYKVRETRGVGDEIIVVRPGYHVRKRDPSVPATMEARLITFQVRSQTLRILTSLTSPSVSAADIASLYAARWEAEMVFDDVKTEQRGSASTLRSKTPDGVLQEVFGLFLAHNIVRVEMARAAAIVGLSPVRISFHRALAEVRHFLQCASATSAPSKIHERELDLRSLIRYLVLPERRTSRWYPRVLKSTIPKYPRKRIVERRELP